MHPNDLFSDFFPDENPDYITRQVSEEIKTVIIKRLVQLKRNEAANRISENDFSELVVFTHSDRYYVYLRDGYKMLVFVLYWETTVITDFQNFTAISRNMYGWDESTIPAEATNESFKRSRAIDGMIAAEKLLKNGGSLIFGADPSAPIGIKGDQCLNIDEKGDALSLCHSDYETVAKKLSWENVQITINGKPVETKSFKYNGNK